MVKWQAYILDKLIFYNVISDDEADIYRFGLECLVLKLLHCISYLCIAAGLKMVPELIVIACVLIPLRRNTGGYHAKSKIGCYFFSCCYVAFTLLAYEVLANQIIWWGMLAVSNVIIFLMSPVDNENKRLDEKERDYYRRKSQFILILANVSCVLFTVINFYIGSLLRCGICADALLLILYKLTEKGNMMLGENISVKKYM